MKKIAVIVTARPSWAKLQTICEALAKRSDVELQIICCASALLERYGRVRDVIAQSFPIAAEVYSVVEGETLLTSVKETGHLCAELGGVLSSLRPSVGVVVADRHEVLAVAQALRYQHLICAHVQGGERSGSIDDRVRDATTQLADIHFPSTQLAQLRVFSLTGSEAVYNFGCPSIDVAKRALSDPPVRCEDLSGSGPRVDLERPFVLVMQHSVTNEANEAYAQMWMTLEACSKIDLPRLYLWPGEDAGSSSTSKAFRVFRDAHPETTWHTVKNLPPQRFLRLLSQASCLVGNSSAGIREASYLGTPVVNIGTRQYGRERGPNVLDVGHDVELIASAIDVQVACGRYPRSTLYGKGNAGERIAEVLCGVD